MQLSPQAAAQHLLNRRRARTDVVTYAGIIEVPGRPLSDDPDDPDCELFAPVETNLAPHHVIILEAMARTAARRYGRLLIFAPPGSAKTSYASVVFPSHYLGAVPGRRLLLASYGDLPAKRMGRRTRSIIRQARYRRIFGADLSQESSAAEQFSLSNGGEYLATSILGSVTSYRADGAVIDDPVKGRKEAQSENVQLTTWEAYTDDISTRLVPGGWLVLIMTRWAHDDIAGRILPEDWNGDSGIFECRDGRQWEVLCLQAKCETTTDPLKRQLGEYLWADWFDREHWRAHERIPRTWNSLYQQRPRAVEGAHFKLEMLLHEGRPVDRPKHVSCVFATIDSANKTGKEHDGLAVVYWGYTRHFVPHTGQDGVSLCILDWHLTQLEGVMLPQWLPSVYERLEQLSRECGAIEGSIGVFIEDRASGTIALQHARNSNWDAHAIESKLTQMGKSERCLSIESYVYAGQVVICQEAHDKTVVYKDSNRNHLLSQILAFVPGDKDMKADDCLDAWSYGIAMSLGNPEGF